MKMKKKKIEKEDGRYLIFYEFEDDAPPSRNDKSRHPAKSELEKPKTNLNQKNDYGANSAKCKT
ncbi:MAG: hypothetical protein AB1546_01600 [bacterium]